MQKVLATVRQALRGENHDYTQGNISEAVVLLAIPMILELSLESVFAVVDMFFVSKLGQAAIATVGLTEAVVTLVYSIAIGLSTGATAIVARRVGEKNYAAAAHAGLQSMLLAGVVSLVLSGLGVFFASDILGWMGASDEVVREGTPFAQIMLGGSTAIVLLFLINGIFRGAGDAAMAMKSLWLASAINIILCPIFIHLFGLKGAAIATLVGRSSGVLYQCRRLFGAQRGVQTQGAEKLQFRSLSWKWDFSIIKAVTKLAFPASLQFIIGSGSWIVLTRLVAETSGTAATAGYQIAFRNFVFFILPAWGLSNAAATLVGQNLGAGLVDRAEKSVFTTAKYNAVFMLGVTLFFILFADPMVRVFTQDRAVVEHGTTALRIIGMGYVFYGLAMVMTQSLNGAGDTRTPTWINFLCLWVFQIPLAYFLSKGLQFQARGAVMSIPVSQALLAGCAWWVFRKGNWKKLKV